MHVLLRKPAVWIVAAWLVAFVLLLARTVPVSGDGIYYYAWLRSVAIDHDVDFANELEHFRANPYVAQQLDSHVATPTGLTPNLYSVGPALLWAPVWLPVHWVAGWLGSGGSASGDGYSRAELLAPSIATGLYGLAGLLLTYGFVRRVLGGLRDPKRANKIAAGATILMLLGTNLVYYLAIESSLAHGLGFFTIALLLYLWWRWRTDLLAAARERWWRWLALGLVVGLAATVRWQLLAVALVVPGIDLLVTLVRRRSLLVWQNAGLVLLGTLIGVTPQLIGWKFLYGSWFTIPQGSGFLDWRSPHFFEVLISTRHGLLTWTPLVIIALVGLLIAAARAAQARWTAALYALAILLVQIYVNGIVLEWWGGDAFGARRFTDIASIVALGLGLMFASRVANSANSATRRRWQRWALAALGVLLVLANLGLLQLYRLGRISRDQPVSLPQVVRAVLP